MIEHHTLEGDIIPLIKAHYRKLEGGSYLNWYELGASIPPCLWGLPLVNLLPEVMAEELRSGRGEWRGALNACQ